MEELLYYILKEPYGTENNRKSELPRIFISEKCKTPRFRFNDRAIAEGPFDSKYELRKKSFILAGINEQKKRDKILANKNITTITSFAFIERNTSLKSAIINSYNHVVIGKVTSEKVKGVHFYNPDRTRIIEIVDQNEQTGVFVANIEVQNEISKQWIRKDDTSFFPLSWSRFDILFRCQNAYLNRKRIGGRKYHGEAGDNITIEFIIDENDKLITFYPLV